MRSGRIVPGALLLLAALLTACGSGDPREELRSERARWSVTPKNYVQAEDGSVRLSVSVSGPAHTKLHQLTFRVEVKDAEGQVVDEEWKTVDLNTVPMGAATDFSYQLAVDDVPFEDLSIDVDRVLDPTPEQMQHIPELQP